MLLSDSLAEEYIGAAIRRGDFDRLPGTGKPLSLDDDSAVPEALRVAYRILKNAGCLPPEQEMRKQIRQVESLLDHVETDIGEQRIRRRLCLLQTRLALQGREVNLLAEEGLYREKLYREKLLRRMARARDEALRN